MERGLPLLSERAFKAIGRPLARKEDARLITGKGRFTDDFTLPGQTWAAMVRSPYPHARILGIDPGRCARAAGRARRLHRRGLCRRRAQGHPAQSGALDAVRREAQGAWRHAGLHWVAHAPAGGQSALCRRGRRHGRRRDPPTGASGGRDGGRRLRRAALGLPIPSKPRSPTRRVCGTNCRTTSWSIRRLAMSRRPMPRLRAPPMW